MHRQVICISKLAKKVNLGLSLYKVSLLTWNHSEIFPISILVFKERILKVLLLQNRLVLSANIISLYRETFDVSREHESWKEIVQELYNEVLHILHLTNLCSQFYYISYIQCIDYGFIDKFKTKVELFLLLHNALSFLIK